ncbi:hypothetical protein KALB_5659 [Kutzneria albida DSM 43870]|uniref:8-amino-7-oxononanoate synthase n=1 Tax=Kutzneria albida DSM 43870 TaxID=1449976 RepID=W5WEJ3_9PSEU|nr:hypothetical protein KALB_5659 [Kutzneria albida DSM 43870]
MIPPPLVSTLDARLESGDREFSVRPGAPGRISMGHRELINMASCDYLGLARHPAVVRAAHDALDDWGLGTAAGRALSGTTVLHRDFERRLASWVGCEDAVLHSSCWAANAAVFATLTVLANQARRPLAVFSDRLNHASIIDGIRAQRSAVAHLVLYDHHAGLDDLRHGLTTVPTDAVKVIVTDGIFSMEGDQAPLRALRTLAEEYGALLVVDDSHGNGVVGPHGRGTAESQQLLGRIDVITGTLGKALGGAIGGFVAGPRALTSTLRSMSRPYTFSNNPPPSVVAGAHATLDVLAGHDSPLATLRTRVEQLRSGVIALQLPTWPGKHPIVPVVIGDEHAAQELSANMIRTGVFVTALTYPVVPRGAARLRLQVSAAHAESAIDHVLNVLADSGHA